MTDPSRTAGRAPDRDLDASRPRRWILNAAGCLLVGIGAIGVVVPLLPTTPFMLLAAACFARGSRRLHAWLLGSRVFGPTIRAWYETRSIPLRTKILAIALVVAFIGASIVLVVSHPAARIGLAVIAAGIIVCLLRIPSRPGAAAEAAPRPEPAAAD
jgi:uncharacterized membrane protein YbaN (DUF454 family)